jgi:hypothetical protein
VHPYLFPHAALKTAAFSNKNKVQKQLDAVVITGDKALSKEAASYIGELASARTVLNTGECYHMRFCVCVQQMRRPACLLPSHRLIHPCLQHWRAQACLTRQ